MNCENSEKLQLSKDIREIAMQLVEKGRSVMNKCQPAPTINHFLKQIPPTAKKKKKPIRICKV